MNEWLMMTMHALRTLSQQESQDEKNVFYSVDIQTGSALPWLCSKYNDAAY